MHREIQIVQSVINETGNNWGGEPLRLVKEGLSEPSSKGLNVVRAEHSSRGYSLGKDPEAGTTSMCSKKRKAQVAGAGVKRMIRYKVVSGDE